MFTQYNCVKNTLKGWFCGDLENLDLQTALRSIHNSYMEFLLPIFWPALIPIARIYRRLKPVDSHARRPAFVIVDSSPQTAQHITCIRTDKSISIAKSLSAKQLLYSFYPPGQDWIQKCKVSQFCNSF